MGEQKSAMKPVAEASEEAVVTTSGCVDGRTDVLGTWMLSILNGHNRYAHVGVLRGVGVAPSILGTNKIITDDSLRRAMSGIAPAPSNKRTADKKAAQQAQVERATKWFEVTLPSAPRA